MEWTTKWKEQDFTKIVSLYDSVGWSAYTEDREALQKAFQNSTYVLLALENNEVVGALRSLSDDVSIHYLQDILIHPDFQHKGIGTKLITQALERFAHVRTHMILTDEEERQFRFYESMGYKNTKHLKKIPLNAFVMMRNVELK